jgi:serine/threonine-protein kinase
VATGLSRIPIAAGVPVNVTEVNREKEELAHRWPQVLPGGQDALFTVYHLTTNYDNSDIEAVSLKTGERRIVYRGGFYGRYLPGGYLVYVHQNILFAARFDLRGLKLIGEPQAVVQGISNQSDAGANFTFSDNGSLVYVADGQPQRSIFSVESAAKPRPLQPTPGRYGFPRFSPDGKRLSFILEDGQGHGDIWVRDLERTITSRLTAMSGRNEWPVWTPDGKNIVFAHLDPPAPGLYAVRSDGTGEPVLLTDGKANPKPSSISPDGKWLATFQPTAGSGVGIFKWPIDGGPDHLRLGTAQSFLVTPFLTILPCFSPDGRWVAYASTEPGKAGLWVRPSSGQGGAWQIGNADGRFSFPVWSRNRLFFLEDRQRIMVVDYTVHGDSFIAGQPRSWSEQRVLNLGSPPIYTYDLAPDGKRLAVVLYPDGTADEKPVTKVTFLINFVDYLRQRLSGLEGTHQ